MRSSQEFDDEVPIVKRNRGLPPRVIKKPRNKALFDDKFLHDAAGLDNLDQQI